MKNIKLSKPMAYILFYFGVYGELLLASLILLFGSIVKIPMMFFIKPDTFTDDVKEYGLNVKNYVLSTSIMTNQKVSNFKKLMDRS